MRVLLIILAVLATLFVGTALVAPLVAEAVVDRVLATLPDYEAGVEDADVSLTGVAALDGLVIAKPGVDHPFVAVDRIEIRPRFGALLRGDRIADVHVEGLVVNYVLGQDAERSQTSIDADWIRRRVEAFPTTVDHLTVRNAALHYRDHAASPDVHLVVDALEVDGTNLANLAGSDEWLFGEIVAHGRVEEHGTVEAHLRLDPYADAPRFTLDAEVRGVPLAAIGDALEAYANFDAEQGTFSAVTHLEARDGAYSGVVTPTVHDLEVVGEREPRREGPLRAIWEAVVGTAADAVDAVTRGEDVVKADLEVSGRFGEDPALVEVLELLPRAWFGALTRAVRVGGRAADEAVEGATEAGRAAEPERAKSKRNRQRN